MNQIFLWTSKRDRRMQRGTLSRYLMHGMLATASVFTLAVPAMAQSATQAQPAVTHAVGGNAAHDGSMIRQVIGKQPSSQPRRALNIFGGRTTSSSSSSSSSSSGRGLLDGLFGSRSSSSSSAGTAAAPINPGSVPAPEPADWDGIPYHQVQSSNSRNVPQPIRDPSATANTSRPAPMPRPAPAPRTTTPQPQLSNVPKPPADDTRIVRRRTTSTIDVPTVDQPAVVSRSTSPLSEQSSSRRSSRLSSRDMTEEKLSAVESIQQRRREIRSDDSIDDLVPRVARRKLTPTEETKAKTQAKTNAPASADVAESKPETGGSSRRQAETPQSKNTVAKAEAKPAPTPKQPVPSAEVTTIAKTPAAPVQQDVALTPPSDTATATESATTLQPPTSQPYAASQPSPSLAIPPAPSDAPAAPTGNATTNGQLAGYPNKDTVSTPPALQMPPAASNLSKTESTNSADNFAATDPYGQRDAAALSMPANAASSTAASEPATTEKQLSASGSSVTEVNQGGIPAMSIPATSDRSTRQLNAGETAVATELPSIRVITQGPAEMMIRQTRPYVVRVENRGSIDAEGLLVRALVPDWAEVKGQQTTDGSVESGPEDSAERLVWTIDRLPAGHSETLTMQLKAMRSGLYDVDVDWTLVPQRSVAKVRVQQPKLALFIDGPDEVVYGESESYKVRVLNPGDGVAPNVVFTLSPNSATPQSQKVGDIPAGKEAQFEVELTAQDLEDLRIHGLAAGDLELRAEAEKVIRVSAAKFEAVLSGPELKYQNSEASYHLDLQNVGTAVSKHVVATLTLPPGVKYLGGLDGASVNGSQLRWKIDSLSPKAGRSYDFRCQMTTTGEQVFAFDCRGTAAGKAEVSLGTAVEAIADLVLSINDPPAPAPVDQDVMYEIVVRNRGSKEARQVRAIAQFSHGIEPTRITGQTGEVLTGQVLFDPIDRIAPGQEIRLQVVARAQNDGHHRFRTEIRSGDITLMAEEATHYMNPRSDRVSRRSTDASNR